uniref:Uncharacterized protein n=1 Tax=Mesocestoides corti TaxID=53468 RepID=A0A5K3FVW9_MESCO
MLSDMKAAVSVICAKLTAIEDVGDTASNFHLVNPGSVMVWAQVTSDGMWNTVLGCDLLRGSLIVPCIKLVSHNWSRLPLHPNLTPSALPQIPHRQSTSYFAILHRTAATACNRSGHWKKEHYPTHRRRPSTKFTPETTPSTLTY